jgi:hypothetical protein
LPQGWMRLVYRDMTTRPEVEDARLAVQMGRMAVNRHRQMLASLIAAKESPEVVEHERAKLATIEILHAGDLAELKRLTTN